MALEHIFHPGSDDSKTGERSRKNRQPVKSVMHLPEHISMEHLITVKQLQKVMAAWSLRFKDREFQPRELDFLTQEYHKDLIGMRISPQRFERIVDKINLSSRFFPTMAEIIEAKNQLDIESARESENETMEYDFTESDDEYAKKAIKTIHDMIDGKITQAEAERILKR